MKFDYLEDEEIGKFLQEEMEELYKDEELKKAIQQQEMWYTNHRLTEPDIELEDSLIQQRIEIEEEMENDILEDGVTIVESFNKNDSRTKGEEKFINMLIRNPRFNGWTVFEQPHINGKKPDFILTHPEKGILIVEVKDWDLTLNSYQDGYLFSSNNKQHQKSPVSQVEGYKDTILKTELRSTASLATEKPQYFYSSIETVVYFSNSNTEMAKAFCNNPKYTKIWTDEHIKVLRSSKSALDAKEYTYAVTQNYSQLNQRGHLKKMVEELNCYLHYSDYNRERKQPFILTSEQKRPLNTIIGSIRRWGGVAGSGKSIILAQKAVNALKKTEEKKENSVLLISFNLTLRHYLRDLCSQQFGAEKSNGERKKLRYSMSIEYFHELLKRIMSDYGIDVGKIKENGDFTEEWLRIIQERLTEKELIENYGYDFIFIDEGQDFKPSWITFLKKLYTKKGEFFIVYDKNQDIYGRFNDGVWIEDSDQVKGIGFHGTAGYLKNSERMPNGIINKINLMRKDIFKDYEEIQVASRNAPLVYQTNLLQSVYWLNKRAYTAPHKLNQIVEVIAQLRKENQWEDITIITTNEYTGVSLVKYYQSHNINVSHVYDLKHSKTEETKQRNRRLQKKNFHGGTGNLKISSYQSYKGWQTPNIVLVLDPTTNFYEINDPKQILQHSGIDKVALLAALFISMTRIKGKSDTGAYSFYCLNYISEFANFQKYFN